MPIPTCWRTWTLHCGSASRWGWTCACSSAVPCPIDIELEVTLDPGTALAAVGPQIDERDPGAASWRPGRFAFGDSLHCSAVVALVAAVPGVEDVTCLRFAFTGEDERRRREVLTPARGQILRLDNDSRRPR